MVNTICYVILLDDYNELREITQQDGASSQGTPNAAYANNGMYVLNICVINNLSKEDVY